MTRKREPYNKIKAFLIENDIDHKKVATILDLKPNTITKKLNGFGSDFSLNEASLLNTEIGVPISYFFEPKVPKKEQC